MFANPLWTMLSYVLHDNTPLTASFIMSVSVSKYAFSLIGRPWKMTVLLGGSFWYFCLNLLAIALPILPPLFPTFKPSCNATIGIEISCRGASPSVIASVVLLVVARIVPGFNNLLFKSLSTIVSLWSRVPRDDSVGVGRWFLGAA